jgi:hypothetical protein
VAFFGARLQEKPNWALALTAPVLRAMLQLVSALLFAEKTLPVARELLIQQNQHAIDMHPFGVAASVVASVSYLITCGMTVLAVVCLDVLFKDSGRLERLAEFTGLTFISQIPYWGLVVIAGCLWSLEPILGRSALL